MCCVEYGNAVVDHFLKVYKQETEKILAEVRNTEAALKRFRKHKSASEGDGDEGNSKTVETSDLVEAQFKRDLEEISKFQDSILGIFGR